MQPRSLRSLWLVGQVDYLLAGPTTVNLSGSMAGLILRSGAVNATMALPYAFIGWFVMRYARSCPVGEPRDRRCMR